MQVTTKYNIGDKVFNFNGTEIVPVTITSIDIIITSHCTSVKYMDNSLGATYRETKLFHTKEEVANSILKQIGVSPNSLLNLSN